MPAAVLFSLPTFAISSIAVDIFNLTGFAITVLVTASSFLTYFTLAYVYKTALKDMEKTEEKEGAVSPNNLASKKRLP
ncbi:protein of unknown function [Moritella yayanosii]|uniref:Uncharacterized protein n=2 Tax=Moritella yayanosii TaxID=69539 RepID=A0A330LP44_9GAMM|nr:protein of unknown function [Moritella yayanosii]